VKITSVVGARPQFVKLGMVDLAIRRAVESRDISIEHRILHTGQHYDVQLSRVFFDELELPSPDVNLGVGSATHGVQTGRMLEGLDEALRAECPDLVLTYGDTNSTLAAALAAAKLHVPVAHVESGLRSFDKRMPEEVNRVVTDHVSTLLYCPTMTAVANLESEGLGERATEGLYGLGDAGRLPPATSDAPWLLNVGDVMYDSVLHHVERASSTISQEIEDLAASDHAIMTVHRAENTDDPSRLNAILRAAERIADEHKLRVLFPAHPRTSAAIQKLPTHRDLVGVHVFDPVSYYDMLILLRSARIALTDSGGVQREAFMLGRPCVTLRDRTEWVELLESGLSALGGAEEDRIAETARRLLAEEPGAMASSPYGDGNAADRIVEVALAWRDGASG